MQTAHGLVAIVEDDAPMRKSIDRLLRANNHSTVSFASAEEFLRSGDGAAKKAIVDFVQATTTPGTARPTDSSTKRPPPSVPPHASGGEQLFEQALGLAPRDQQRKREGAARQVEMHTHQFAPLAQDACSLGRHAGRDEGFSAALDVQQLQRARPDHQRLGLVWMGVWASLRPVPT